MQEMQSFKSKFIINLSYLLLCSESIWFNCILMYSACSYCGRYSQLKCLTTSHFTVQ